MDDGVEVRVLGENSTDQQPVSDIALVELTAHREFTPARHQAVQDHRDDSRVRAGRGDCAADVASSPGDEDFHRPSLHLLVRLASLRTYITVRAQTSRA